MSGNITEINKDTFWTLITEAKARCGQDMDASAKWVEEQLLQMRPEQAQNSMKSVKQNKISRQSARIDLFRAPYRKIFENV